MENHPDDVLLEILSKLPIKSLLRFQCVSKPWRSLISDPQSRKKLPPAMAGLFSAGAASRFVSLASRSFVDPSTIDSRLSFLPESGRILGVCNGLLLLSNPNALFVCNPATRKWAKISKPPRVSSEFALAFDPNSDTHFKIVYFPLPEHGPTRPRGSDEVDVFSSEIGSWSTVSGIAGLSEVCFANTRIAYSKNESFYVLDVYYGRTFALDLKLKECRPLHWPDGSIQKAGLYAHCFGFFRGMLHIAFVMRDAMHVCVLEDSSSGRYVLRFRKSMREIMGKFSGCMVLVDVPAFHPDLDVIFLQLQFKYKGYSNEIMPGILFSYHWGSGKLEEICIREYVEPMFAYAPCYNDDLKL